ncbi:unnamed protein product [Lampetra fluviatilis]
MRRRGVASASQRIDNSGPQNDFNYTGPWVTRTPDGRQRDEASSVVVAKREKGRGAEQRQRKGRRQQRQQLQNDGESPCGTGGRTTPHGEAPESRIDRTQALVAEGHTHRHHATGSSQPSRQSARSNDAAFQMRDANTHAHTGVIVSVIPRKGLF